MRLTAIRNTREKLNIAAKTLGIKEPGKMSITDLLEAMHRYRVKCNSYRLCRKFKRLGLPKYVKKKKKHVSENDLREATELNNISLRDLKNIAKLRRIKNYEDMSKEDLIYTLSRSKKNILENNYMKYINNAKGNEMHTRINNRITVAKLGNILIKRKKYNQKIIIRIIK